MEPSQDFTSFLLGRPVIVKLNSGVDYRGKQENRDLSQALPGHDKRKKAARLFPVDERT